MSVELSTYQLDAIHNLTNGKILCGGFGSGKSRTAIGYYVLKETKGMVKITGSNIYTGFKPMSSPRDLIIITTAKKRDSLEWEKELSLFSLYLKDGENPFGVKRPVIDSWNNIKKYQDIYSAFFIFDEQRVIGRGAWVKAFLNITRKNHWILLSATPGDSYLDYIPVFIANGFYKNRTEFEAKHCIFSRYTKFKKVERFINTKKLNELQNKILVMMNDDRKTVQHRITIWTDFDKKLFRTVMRDRWDPYENHPIEDVSKLLYLIRRVVNSDPSRINAVAELLSKIDRVIIFYNFNYELDLLRELLSDLSIPFAEWNGSKHDPLPKKNRFVYLAQYQAAAEGWNCTTIDTIIFYSQNYSYRLMEQASGRIDRINTMYTDLYYYYLRSRSSIDTAIYNALERKQNFNERSFMKGI